MSKSIIFALTAGMASVAVNAQQCPGEFHAVPLHERASVCHSFNSDTPASMSYHAPLSPADTVTFYKSALGEPEQESLQKGRTVLQFAQKVVVISADAAGSQVDILIK
ncbi:hypothetical protein [Bowmanella sp. JS7-9]|uniref:Uncharacterized protein n=1 Tax=Pseudobowmanella zhangzhouensis TaxID=1537679 RepID=A0ABW1XPP3_9ALTE|nr:hypothetical protein [Bowmanella sp. JS7-9]